MYNYVMEQNKIYIAYYNVVGYDDYGHINVFASTNKSKVTKWCTKFNKILKKWKGYYSQFEVNRCGIKWIDEQYLDKYFDRWNFLRNINKASYIEINLR